MKRVNSPITFKAAVLKKFNKPLVIHEVTFNGPLEFGQVLVQIHYSGICGKQIEEIHGSSGSDPYLPHMLGHEGGGVVVDIGPGVTRVSKGDHVVLHWVKGYGINANTPIYSRGGNRINAGWITTFNEYGVISENRVTVVPKNTDLSLGCLLGCSVTTGLGVIFNEANVKPSESVVVFGCGGVGLNVIQGASISNGYPIIAVDRKTESINMALEFGASHGILMISENDVISEIMDITNGQGVQYVIIAAGEPEIFEIAVNVSSVPGKVFFVGVPSVNSKISIDPLAIHRGRILQGSSGGCTIPNRDIPKL